MIKILFLIESVVIYPFVCFLYIILSKRIVFFIKKDFERWCDWQNRAKTIWGFSLLFAELKEFRTVVYKRIGWRRLFFSWLWHGQQNCSIACNDIGPGLNIQHGYCSIIAAKKIGKNFSFNQCVNVVWNYNEQCIIGDNVKLATGVIVIGGVHIGNNVYVGAGSVVTKNIPDNCVVVGNPAHIIRENGKKIINL